MDMSERKRKAVPVTTPVVVRLPHKAIAAIDKAAEANCRSRSSEIRLRLMQTLPKGAAL